MNSIKLLALSGSLRRDSLNAAALKAVAILAPDHVEVSIGSIAGLPLFNPDLERQQIPAVEALAQAVKQADGLILASPEYAHGISGPMKNALDWLVSGDEFPDKPIMLINTSPRASHAQAALREVVTTMSGKVIDGSCVSVPLLGRELQANSLEGSEEIIATLKQGLEALRAEIS